MLPSIAVDPAPTIAAPLLDQVAVVRLIGNTPLVPLCRIAEELGFPASVQLWLKAEWSNPGGSVKDRTALAIIRNGLERGELSDRRGLLDATSGNTGIAYAMLGAALGLSIHLVVPGSASDERKRLLAAYGAHVIYSDPYDGSDGAIRVARQLRDEHPERYWYADQYNNPANPWIHRTTTGPEIWQQSGGQITHLVAGLGTSGTLMGAGAALKSRNPAVALVAVEPTDAFHGIEGLKHMASAIVPGIYDPTRPDIHVAIETGVAYECAQRLARTEGLLVGISTGAAFAAAARLGARLVDRGEVANMVIVAPDGGSRYLSTALWGG